MSKGQNNAPAGAPPRDTSTAPSSPPDTRGDFIAANTAAGAFNNFTSTIESVVAAALAQAGLNMVINLMAGEGMQVLWSKIILD